MFSYTSSSVTTVHNYILVVYVVYFRKDEYLGLVFENMRITAGIHKKELVKAARSIPWWGRCTHAGYYK